MTEASLKDQFGLLNLSRTNLVQVWFVNDQNGVLVEFKHDFETARLFEEAMYEGRDSYREMVKMSKRNW